MKFTCDRELFSESLQSISRIVTPHAAKDILKGLLIEAGSSNIRITANNLENAVLINIEANVEEEGSCVIEAKILCDIVRRLTGDMVSVHVDSRLQVTMVSLLSEYTLLALPADKYPSIPEVSGLRSLTLSQAVLRRQLERTTFSVSTNESKLIHTGVLFDVEPGTLTLVALDGHRLALSRESIDTLETFSFVTPSEPLQFLEKALSQDEELMVTLHIGTRYILFEMSNTTVVSRLLEGEFLKYRNSIPKGGSFSAVVNVKSFMSAVESVSILIDDKLKNPVRMKFDEGNVQLTCITGRGRGFESVAIQGGSNLEIGFNNRYILDALRHVPDEEVKIEGSGPLSAFLILPVEGDDFLFLVLPVRLKSE